MRLGLDLDGTLTPQDEPFASGLEPQNLAARALLVEPLRLGTRALWREARARGWQLWVYTSSARSVPHVHATFWLHGLRVDGVINEAAHREEERRQRRKFPVKYPPAFGIDLLIDDSVAVEAQGRAHGFRVLRLGPGDLDWGRRVMAGG